MPRPEERGGIPDQSISGKVEKSETSGEKLTEVRETARVPRTQQDLEQMYPNIRFFMAGEDLSEGSPVLSRISEALNTVMAQIGEDKFRKLRINFLDVGSKPSIQQDGTLLIGLFNTRRPEDLAREIVENVDSVLSIKQKAETESDLFESLRVFNEEFDESLTMRLGSIQNPGEFKKYLAKLSQILNDIKATEGEHRTNVHKKIEINDNGGSRDSRNDLILDLSEDSASVRQAILEATEYNNPR